MRTEEHLTTPLAVKTPHLSAQNLSGHAQTRASLIWIANTSVYLLSKKQYPERMPRFELQMICV